MAATSVDHHGGAVLRRTPSASRSNLRSVPMIVAVRPMSSKVRLHRVRNPSEDFPALVTDVSQAAMGRGDMSGLLGAIEALDWDLLRWGGKGDFLIGDREDLVQAHF